MMKVIKSNLNSLKEPEPVGEKKKEKESAEHTPEGPKSPFTFSGFDIPATQSKVVRYFAKYAHNSKRKEYLIQSLNEAAQLENPEIFSKADFSLWSETVDNAYAQNDILARETFRQLPEIVKTAVEGAKAVFALSKMSEETKQAMNNLESLLGGELAERF